MAGPPQAHPPLPGAPNATADATPLSPEQQEGVVAGRRNVIAGWTAEEAQKAARERDQTWQNIKAWFSNLF